ncbi:MAG TPA: hypothetical protein VF928_10455 [Usitatibacteraceae bacterium]
MSSHRFIRKLAASAAALGILFAQFMVAAYACPVVAQDIQAQQSAEAPMPCHQQSDKADGLCEAHCQDSHKNVASAINAIATDFVPAFVARLPEPQPATQVAAAASIDETSPHHSPPILLRNACFRI